MLHLPRACGDLSSSESGQLRDIRQEPKQAESKHSALSDWKNAPLRHRKANFLRRASRGASQLHWLRGGGPRVRRPLPDGQHFENIEKETYVCRRRWDWAAISSHTRAQDYHEEVITNYHGAKSQNGEYLCFRIICRPGKRIQRAGIPAVGCLLGGHWIASNRS